MLGWQQLVAGILSLALHRVYAANSTLSSGQTQPILAGYGPEAQAQSGSRRHRKWPPKPPITNSQCPVRKCRGIPKKDVVNYMPTFIETSSSHKVVEPNEPIKVTWTEPDTPNKVYDIDDDSKTSIYDVDFKPGHFTCMSCDVGTCAGCDIICDLSQCLGEFYEQECWCRKDTDVKLKKPLWWYREYDSKFLTHDTVYQMFCDDNCGGGICDTQGLMCKKREDGCKPWWWCNLPPPREDNLNPADGWGDGFSYSKSMVLAQMNMKHEKKHKETGDDVATLNARVKAMMSKTSHTNDTTEVASEGHQFRRKVSALQMSDVSTRHESAAHGAASSEMSGKPRFEPNDFGKLKFQPGRFVCESAALPPKVQNPKSYLWVDRGYIVLDRFSCRGSLFDHKCLCWDNFSYLQGKDPMTSEFNCDDSCTWGQCEGRTCGKKAPPPLPAPTDPPPEDPLEHEKKHKNELHNVHAPIMEISSAD